MPSICHLHVTGKGPEAEHLRHYLRHHPKVTEQGLEVEYLRHHPKVTEKVTEVTEKVTENFGYSWGIALGAHKPAKTSQHKVHFSPHSLNGLIPG